MGKSSFEKGDLQLDATLKILYSFQNKADLLFDQSFSLLLLQDIKKSQERIIFHQNFIRENRKLHSTTLEDVADIEELLNQLDGGE